MGQLPSRLLGRPRTRRRYHSRLFPHPETDTPVLPIALRRRSELKQSRVEPCDVVDVTRDDEQEEGEQ